MERKVRSQAEEWSRLRHYNTITIPNVLNGKDGDRVGAGEEEIMPEGKGNFSGVGVSTQRHDPQPTSGRGWVGMVLSLAYRTVCSTDRMKKATRGGTLTSTVLGTS